MHGNTKEARELKKSLQYHEPAKKVVNALLGVVSASSPELNALVLAAKVGFSIYEDVKEYKETGSISNLNPVGI